MKHVKIMLIISLVLFIALYSLPAEEESLYKSYDLNVKPARSRRMIASYIDRTSIINITSDTDFEIQADDKSWPGQGTWDNPYIIQNFNITNTSTCITIHNVSVYFVIRGCLLNTTSQYSGHGIILDNVTHCYIENCITHWKSNGIILIDCKDVVIDNCVLTNHQTYVNTDNAFNTTIINCVFTNTNGGGDGVWLSYSDNCTIYNNSITHLGGEMGGIYCANSDFVNITENDVSDNWNGVYLMNCDDALIFNNTINRNGYEGVYLESCDRCTLELNEIEYNQAIVTGVHAENSPHLLILDNDISHNYMGVSISNSIYCNLTNNDIESNLDDGVEISSSHSSTFHNNTIGYNGQYGIALVLSNSTTFTNNTIFENWYDGIYVDKSEDCTFYNNTLYANSIWMSFPACSIELNSAHRAILIDNVIHDDYEHGIGVHLSDNCSLIRNKIYNNWDHGVYATSSWNVTLIDNEIYDNDNGGVYLYDCENCTLDDNRIYNNIKIGIALYGRGGSPNATVSNNFVYGNGDHGIYLENSYNSTIFNNTIYNNTDHGIEFQNSDSCDIIKNMVYDNGWTQEFLFASGIYILSSDYCDIIQNQVHNNSQHGMHLESSDNCVIFNNTIYSNWGYETPACGIHLVICNWCNITLNKIYNNTYDGIFVGSCINGYFANNTVFNNTEYGIHTSYSNFTCEYNIIYNNGEDGLLVYYEQMNGIVIYRNIIFDNGGYGIHLFEVYSSEIYYNDVAWNSVDNAYHSADGGFYWDDGEGIGNWWSDYDWSGDYDISGISTDRYPDISLACGNSTDLEYEFQDTGNSMTWNATALNPWKWEAYYNDTPTTLALFDSGMWAGSDIDVDVDGFSVGVYNITLVVFHISGHFCYDSSLLSVVDTTAPTWDETPVDQVVEYGTGFSYTVSASDPSGIDEYWVNDTTHFAIYPTGVITNNTFLNAGVYGLQISVNDTYENVFFIIISITVQDTIPPEWVVDPEDQILEYGQTLDYDLDASDLSGLDEWWLNNTENFDIDVDGVVTNVGLLPVGVYGIEVRVNDTYGNELTSSFNVIVEDTTKPQWVVDPEDQMIEFFFEGLNYDLNATDLSPLDTWWLNDTNFIITTEGIVHLAGVPSVGSYVLLVSVNDTYGNTLTGTFNVTVQDTTDPEWSPQPTNQVEEYGSSFSYDLHAVDASALTWTVNDTTSFAIDTNGLITNTTTLSLGEYWLEVAASDPYENSISATFKVTVQDTKAPVFVDVPDDVEVEEGTTVILLWNVSDLCPSSYSVLVDDELFTSGEWNTSMAYIVVVIIGLEPGEHNATITIEDCGGNTATDLVEIDVTEVVTPTTSTTTTTTTTTTLDTNTTMTTSPPPILPVDPTTLTLAIAGAGGAIAVIVVVIVISKRRGGG